jgi:eukaryotic-like serine/threonine-protein kinase
MGEVWRATDTRLGRDVALKLLPEAFSPDPDRLARFEREAKLLASLSHPNIATLFGLEEIAGQRILAMELVEGEDLSERLKRGPIPVDEAVAIAKQIAEAVEEAHEKGVVHRDLKPANVKLTPDGKAKVLDFGLAKAWSGNDELFSSRGSALSQSPTLARTGTAAGLILGTAAYMAPEQARGKPVDKRSDIWSFGVVLFEMLTGRKLFDGETVTDVLAAVVRQDIDWSALPADTPATLRRLMRRCLERDPKKRLRDVGEARFVLDEGSRGETTDAEGREGALVDSPATPWIGLRQVVSFVALAAAAAAGAGYWAGRTAAPAASMTVTHLEMGLAPSEKLGPVGRMERPYRHAFALTPDGRRVVFTGVRGETTQLYVRSLDAREAVALPGTEGADTPFLSPDGRWVAFLADGRIRRTPLDGGPVEIVADLTRDPRSVSPLVAPKEDLFGASWGDGDVIVFGRYNDGLWKVRAGGGTPVPLTTLGKDELAHRLPRVLPGGKAVLFHVRGPHDALAVVSVDGGAPRRILESAGDARYSPTGHLVYVHGAILMAAPFDLASLTVTGTPVALFDGVLVASGVGRPALDTGAAQFDVSAGGTLVYATGGQVPGEPTRLVWVDRTGRVEPLGTPPGIYARPRLSPDGRKIVVARMPSDPSAMGGLSVFDLGRGSFGQITEQDEWGPAWSADGTELFFGGRTPLGRVRSDGTGKREWLGEELHAQASSAAPDGSVLAILRSGPGTGTDIWLMPLRGGGEPRPWLQTQANEAWAEFSPDGRWMAYASDVSGRDEVYVRPFPGPGTPYQVSVEGGRSPLWARGGRELFFVKRDGRLTAVMVADVTGSVPFSAGRPRLLLKGRFTTLGGPTGYDVSPDGRRLLLVEELDAPVQPATRLDVVLGWPEELRRAMARAQAR